MSIAKSRALLYRPAPINMLPAPILYVENCPDDIELARLIFRQLKVANPLHIVRNGDEAMDYLLGRGQFSDREKCPFPGIVWLDISMPGQDGFQILETIRETDGLRDLPVFMFSNFNEPEDHERAKQLGATGFIAKAASYKSFASWLEDLNARLHAADHPEAAIFFNRE